MAGFAHRDFRSSMSQTFTDDHLLRLLQLKTGRVMAERQDRTPGADDRGARLDARTGHDPAGIDYPSRWRLLADGTSLYEWQRQCLPLWLAKGRGTVKVATGGGKTTFARRSRTTPE